MTIQEVYRISRRVALRVSLSTMSVANGLVVPGHRRRQNDKTS